MRKSILLVALTTLLAACAAPAAQVEVSPTEEVIGSQSSPAQAEEPTQATGLADTDQAETMDLAEEPVETEESTDAADSVSTPQSTVDVSQVKWQEMPVIPEISQTTIDIYRRGLEMGNDPHSFSVLGECQSELAWEANGIIVQGYLSGFDDPASYTLGEDYAYLQTTIDQFMPSWTQQRVAAHRGTNVAQVLSPMFADADLCEVRQSPLQCEFARNNPSIVLISFETWFYDRPIEVYEGYMRQIIEYSIEGGVVPVLVTGAESHDDSQALNATLAKLAIEYDIPLWNFWRAVQPLPNAGVEPRPDENGFKHLTYGPNNFEDPDAMQTAWPVRNLTGLQMLNAIWQAGGQPTGTQTN